MIALAAGVEVLALTGESATEPESVRTVMLVGLLMIGAWLSGMLCERIQVPAITGYLLFGVFVGPNLLNLVGVGQITPGPHGEDPPMQFASDLAITLIALTAGGEIHLNSLRGRLGQIAAVLAMHMLVLMLGVVLAVVFLAPYVPFLRDIGGAATWVVAVLCAVVMVAKSPAVTIAMISDYNAHGPLSQTTLVITVFKDLVLIVLFATVMAIGKGVLDPDTPITGTFLFAVAFQLVGSLLLGAVMGLAMAYYVEVVRSHLSIFVIGSCLLIALIGEQHVLIAGHECHFKPLLMALAAGLVMQNVWPKSSAPLFTTIEHTSLPVFCLFFALAAAKIDLRALATLWPWSLGLVGVRMLMTWGGTRLGVMAAGMRDDWAKLLWLGMISQAGVSLLLVTLITEKFEDTTWAEPLKQVLIGTIFINQIIGPFGFRHALLASGEGRRPSAAPRPAFG